MNNFNFGEILTRAWQIIWKHKILWVFGILAIPTLIFVTIAVLAALFVIIPASQSNGSAMVGSLFALIPLLIGCTCIFVLLMLVLRLFFTQAERAIVLEDMSVMPALSRGWE